MNVKPFSVLLVDDDDATCNMFQLVMDHYKLRLSVLRDAESALAYLSSDTPDVIVMDIFLPGMDGYQALQKIRKDALATTTAVVATTAYYTTETQNDIMTWGFNGYLPKPLNPTTMVKYLQDVVNQARQN